MLRVATVEPEYGSTGKQRYGQNLMWETPSAPKSVACTSWVRITCKIRVHELGEPRRFEVQKCSKDHVRSGLGFQLDHHGREVCGC